MEKRKNKSFKMKHSKTDEKIAAVDFDNQWTVNETGKKDSSIDEDISDKLLKKDTDDSAGDTDEGNFDTFADGSSVCESNDEMPDEPSGNTAWAHAMSNVLHMASKSRNQILSKARKDDVIKTKKEREVEVVDESGNIIPQTVESSKEKSYKERRKEMLEKQKLKADWEAMCRRKPDITNKDRERELVKIATRGVVHLFNTVEKHQKMLKTSKKETKAKKIGVVKGNFMDLLKDCSKKDKKSDEDSAAKKVKREETWSILKDDFMMGAEMKDWDKESDTDM